MADPRSPARQRVATRPARDRIPVLGLLIGCLMLPVEAGEVSGTATLACSATLTLNPSSIGATTGWPGMPANLTQSDVTVTWTPAECVGTLEIVHIEGTDDYVPPGNGTLEQESDTLWRYTAFDEPITTLCPKEVRVWIAAMQGDEELTRESVLVLPVHTRLVTGANADFQKDYDYITWKYATVLATTGGAFTGGVTFSSDASILCPPIPIIGTLGYACTTLNPLTGNYSVVFGTATFAGSENQTASIIGHELVHTTGANECPAYQWESVHRFQTAIYPCDRPYDDSVNDYLFDNMCP